MLGTEAARLSASPLVSRFALAVEETSPDRIRLAPRNPRLEPFLRLEVRLDGAGRAHAAELRMARKLVFHPGLGRAARELVQGLLEECLPPDQLGELAPLAGEGLAGLSLPFERQLAGGTVTLQGSLHDLTLRVEQPERRCPSCQSALPLDARFCPACGKQPERKGFWGLGSR